MKRTEKIICYVLMCVSSFSGMYMLYETVLREVSSWEGGLNASAAFGLTLLLKYPVLFLMILGLIVMGGVGFFCIGSVKPMQLRLRCQKLPEIVFYGVVQIGFLLLTIDRVHFGDWYGAASFIPLSVALYLLVVWIGNIHAASQLRRCRTEAMYDTASDRTGLR